MRISFVTHVKNLTALTAYLHSRIVYLTLFIKAIRRGRRRCPFEYFCFVFSCLHYALLAMAREVYRRSCGGYAKYRPRYGMRQTVSNSYVS